MGTAPVKKMFFRLMLQFFSNRSRGGVRFFRAFAGVLALVGILSGEITAATNEAPQPVGDWDYIFAQPDARYNHIEVWTGEELLIWGGRSRWNSVPTSGGRYSPSTGVWRPISTNNAPAYTDSGAVWTGSELFVWSGDRGFRYDPATDRWTAASTNGAPLPQSAPSAVWTGKEVIIWGGGGSVLNGGRYDPVADAWKPISTNGAPPNVSASAVWTGKEMLVWGSLMWSASWSESYAGGVGGRYNPATDTWQPIHKSTFPRGVAMISPLTWTGSEMIVLGFLDFPSNNEIGGGRYDPELDAWKPIELGNFFVSPRGSVVWTGKELIFWSGDDPYTRYFWNGGAAYNPSTESWRQLAAAPLGARAGHGAVWTGTEMLVWGGYTWSGNPFSGAPPLELNDGASYNPENDQWHNFAGTWNQGRMYHTAIWSGREMLIWGGGQPQGTTSPYTRMTGDRYDPVANRWSRISSIDAPLRRASHTAVWTGGEMIIWGGMDQSYEGAGITRYRDYNDGAVYDPLRNAWTAVSTNGAPTNRYSHLAVWTGEEMVVWGGRGTGQEMIVGDLEDKGEYKTDGGRYNPITKEWQAMSTNGAPAGRTGATVIWTGSEAIIWGGFQVGTYWIRQQDGSLVHPVLYYNTGARYNPKLNSWTAVTESGAPSARGLHTAVWSGKEMLVWGGTDGDGARADGARYDPVSDVWRPMAAEGAPSARSGHTAVWTGSAMLVSGGAATGSGGLYDPERDRWILTTDSDAPPLHGHTAVWTGTELLTYGGESNASDPYGAYTASHETFRYTPYAPEVFGGLAAQESIVSWRYPYSGFQLQISSNFSAWTTISSERLKQAGDRWEFRTPSVGRTFYRLKK